MARASRRDSAKRGELVNEEKRIPMAMLLLIALALVAYFLRGMFV